MEALSNNTNEAKDSWWPVVFYFPLLFVSAIILYIPLVSTYPDFFQEKDSFNSNWHEHFWLYTVSQLMLLIATCVTTYIAISLDKRFIKEYGFSFDARKLIVGLVIGSASMVGFVLLSSLTGNVQFSYAYFTELFLHGILIYFLISVTEEFLIRGYLLFKLKRKIGAYPSLLITSLIFGALHLGNDHITWIGFTNITLSGLLIGMMVLQTNSISPAIGIHWAWNFVQGSVFGFGVSGHKEQGVFMPTNIGNDSITGGAFGAEGSLILIPITLLFIVLIYRSSSKKSQPLTS